MRNIFAIFAKQPTPGHVKTRLAAATSPEFAAQVAEAMLRDTLDRMATIDAERWLVYSPHDATAAMADYARGQYQLTPQGDGDLGQRLLRFFQQRMRDGTEHIVVIGADSPTLPVEFVKQAFDELQRADLVLGPATDGGYYLIGCAQRVPPIFDGVAWGFSTVFRDTIARFDATTRVALLPPWYDVDTLDDLRVLSGHVGALVRIGMDPGCARTQRMCATLETRNPAGLRCAAKIL